MSGEAPAASRAPSLGVLTVGNPTSDTLLRRRASEPRSGASPPSLIEVALVVLTDSGGCRRRPRPSESPV